MVISLITDFGLNDNYVGVMKGVLLGINPEVKIVDICHSVARGDIFKAAFFLKSSFRYFPRGTIHLSIVDPSVGSKREAIIVKTDKYWFVGPDNGVLSFALEEERIETIIAVNNKGLFLKPLSCTFHGRDVFSPVAAYLSCGKDFKEFGVIKKDYKRLEFPKPKVIDTRHSLLKGRKKAGNKILMGKIIHIDYFGDLVTNIQQEDFKRFVGKKRFKINFKKRFINKINRSYDETEKGNPLAIFGSFSLLEISVNCGSAKDYFSAEEGQAVEVLVN